MTSAASLAFVQFLDVLADPPAAVRRISDGRAQWLLLAAIVGAVAAIFQFVETGALFGRVAAALTPEQAVQMHSRFAGLQALAALTAPVVVLARVLLAGYVIWAGTLLAEIDVPLGQVLAVVASAQIVTVLHSAANALIQTLAHVQPRGGFEVAPSLFLHGGLIAHELALLNPFALWYLAVIVLAVRLLAHTSWRNAIVTLVPYTVLFVVFYTIQALIMGVR
jgi:hypothetical protein